jgi:hypothetical protein
LRVEGPWPIAVEVLVTNYILLEASSREKYRSLTVFSATSMADKLLPGWFLCKLRQAGNYGYSVPVS